MRLRHIFTSLALLAGSGYTATEAPDKITQHAENVQTSAVGRTDKDLFTTAYKSLIAPKRELALGPSGFSEFTPKTFNITAHAEYCKRSTNHCAANYDTDVYIPLTQHLLDVLHSVNTGVNKYIKPKHDNENYGGDYYTVATPGPDGKAYGDCDDYALTKLSILEKFIPKTAMSLAFVHILKNGEYDGAHAILVVRTLKGELVLDNLSDKLKSPQATGYKFIGMTEPHNQAAWRAVKLLGSGEPVRAMDFYTSAMRYSATKPPFLTPLDESVINGMIAKQTLPAYVGNHAFMDEGLRERPSPLMVAPS